MQLLKLPNIAKEETVNFQEIEKNSFIDVSVMIQRPPVAIGMGQYLYKGNYYPIPFGSYGDFSCIVGASKSMKTKLKQAIVAGYIGGQSSNYFPDVKGFETDGKYIADFDTEQSTYHTQRSANNVCEMVGTNPDFYLPFSLREYDAKTRMEFIEWFYCESKYKNNLGLVSIDGAADLLDNVNDLELSNKLVGNMLKWTKQTNSHLITVLHRNHGTQKPTGHLGSAITKKAETVAFVTKDGDTVKVTPEYTRNYPFNEFYFTLNEDYLPCANGSKNGIF